MESIIYMTNENWLNVEEYYNILVNYQEERVSSKPPVRPEPSSIYLYKAIDTSKILDWKADQWRWLTTGRKHLPKYNPLITCHYFRTYEGEGFYKRAFVLFDINSNYQSLTLIHYVGSLKNVIHKHHGNRKNKKEVKHVMTAKSQLEKQKYLLTEAPHTVYKKLILEDEHPAFSPVLQPRDRKQVANSIVNERERRLLSSDDIVGLYLLSDELNCFIRNMVLLPHFYCIIFSSEMTDYFLNLRNPTLFYDTTFNLGDFYVSLLTFKNPQFIGEPVIPFVYMIHHKKNLETHESFFEFVKTEVPAVEGKTIVTDREAAICSAIRRVLPNNQHFFCWNHIKQDVKFWVKKQKNTEKSDYKLYIHHVSELLESESYTDFQYKYDVMSQHWSNNFKTYFDENIFHTIETSGKWKLLKYNLYTHNSGITINPAESINAVLKRYVQRREVKAQVLALCLYQLDLYYQKEIARTYCNMGNYKLKDEFFCLEKEPHEILYPQQHLDLDKLPYIFENKTDFSTNKESIEEMPYTKFSIAKMLVLQGCVRLLPEDQAFLITSSNEKKHLVTLFPSETCTCKAKKYCHHIEAAYLSIGSTRHKQKNVKLSNIMKRARGYRSGRKAGPGNITVVEAADDSLIKISGNPNDGATLLIPTLSKSSVKQKFVAPFNKDSFYCSTPLSTKSKESHISPIAKNFPKISKKNISPINIDVTSESCSDSTFIQTDDPEAHFTFLTKMRNNKEFKIAGRSIYPSELNSLIPVVSNPKDDQLYISETIFDIYFSILIANRTVRQSVSIFSVEGYIINSIESDVAYETALRYFFKFKVPDYDIVLCPFTKFSHCRLIVLLRKQKIILYLDSLGGASAPHDEINFIMSLYKIFYSTYNTFFSLDEWTIIVPEDIPHQYNFYDCGLYCCMFAEIIINGDDTILNYHFNNNLFTYRRQIKNVLVNAMKSIENIITPRTYSFNNSIINTPKEAIKISKIVNKINNTSVVIYLKNLVDKYWDEDTLLQCFLGEDCKYLFDTMILCEKCNHWFHKKCINIRGTLPKKFICNICKINK